MFEQLGAKSTAELPDNRAARLRSSGEIGELETYRMVIDEIAELDLEAEIDDILWLPLSRRTCQQAGEIYRNEEKFDTALRLLITEGKSELLCCLTRGRTSHPPEVFYEFLAGGLIAFSAFYQETRGITGVYLPQIDEVTLADFQAYRQLRLTREANPLESFHNHQPALSEEIYELTTRDSAAQRLAMYDGAYLVSQLLKFSIHKERTPNRVITS